MKHGQKLWARDELVLAINLYCKLPFGKMHSRNEEIKSLALLIGRTPDAVARKLVNFASFDPTLKSRGIKGLANASKLDKEIWNEFFNNWDDALLESEKLLADKRSATIEDINNVDSSDIPRQGIEKERMIKTRVNQSLFRNIVLATYSNKCCMTNIDNPRLLIASHIVPWSKDEKNRLSPMNGLCLNALHDRAFDAGLISVSASDYTILLSPKLKKKKLQEFITINFLQLEGKKINLPDKFLPSSEQLKIHNEFFNTQT